MDSLNTAFQRLFASADGNSMGRVLATIVSIIAVISSILIVLSNGSSGEGGGADSGSSDDEPVPGVLQPGDYLKDASRAGEDSELIKDLTAMMVKSRQDAGVDDARDNFDLNVKAQQHADRNAQRHEYTSVTEPGVVALQASLPYEQATDEAFFRNWLGATDSHCALASTFSDFGVGAASANGRTFAVIYIQGITAEHEACVTLKNAGTAADKNAGNNGSS